MTDAAAIGAAVAVQVRIAVAEAMSQLGDAIGAQATSIASGATPAEVLTSIQAAAATISQQLAQDLP